MVKDSKFYKALLYIALPAAFQSLVSFGINLLDTVMVGSLGEFSLSGVSLGNQVSVFLLMFIKGISAGASVMIAQYWGKKDLVRIKSIFSIGFKLSIAVSAVFFLSSVFFPKFVISIFTSDNKIIEEGIKYLTLVSFSFIIMSISENAIAMLRSVEIVKISILVSIFSFFVNLIGNYLLIFGKFGFPQMGVQGAALSTVIARLIELLILIYFVKKYTGRLKFKFSDIIFTREKYLWLDYLKYGMPLAATDIIWGMVNTFKTIIIGHLGAMAVSANSIADVVLQLAMMFITGLSAATSVMIGKCVGAGENKKAREYSNTMQIIFLALGIIAAIVTYLIRESASNFYNVSPDTKKMASDFLIYGALTIWATAYAASSFLGINRGSGDVKFVFKVNMICGWLIVLPLSAIAAFILKWPPPIVFFFTRSDQIIKVVVAFIRLRGNKWIKNVTRE